jgi:hypothetical protein
MRESSVDTDVGHEAQGTAWNQEAGVKMVGCPMVAAPARRRDAVSARAPPLVRRLVPQRLDQLGEQHVGDGDEPETHGEVAPPPARDDRNGARDERHEREACEEPVELDLADECRRRDVIEDGLDGVPDRRQDRRAGSNPTPTGYVSPARDDASLHTLIVPGSSPAITQRRQGGKRRRKSGAGS